MNRDGYQGYFWATLALGTAAIAMFWYISVLSDRNTQLEKAIFDPYEVFTIHLSHRIGAEMLVSATDEENNEYIEVADVTVEPKASDEVSNNIIVTRINWPDGGYTTFDDSCVVVLGGQTSCPSTNGDEEIYAVHLSNIRKLRGL